MAPRFYSAEDIRDEILAWAERRRTAPVWALPERDLSGGWFSMLLRLEPGDTHLHQLLQQIGNESGCLGPHISTERLAQLQALARDQKDQEPATLDLNGWRDEAARLPSDYQVEFTHLGKSIQSYWRRWGLFVVQFDDEISRQSLSDAIIRATPNMVRMVIDQHAEWGDVVALAREAAKSYSCIELDGFDQWLSRTSEGQNDIVERRMRSMNIGREIFSKTVNVPVLVWLRPPRAAKLASVAPDLWSWRASVHRFLGEAPSFQSDIAP